MWFAQLWRNTDNRDGPPTFWLGLRPPAEWACQIVDAIVAVTGADRATVERAMGDSAYLGAPARPPRPAQRLNTAVSGLLRTGQRTAIMRSAATRQPGPTLRWPREDVLGLCEDSCRAGSSWPEVGPTYEPSRRTASKPPTTR